MRGAENYEVIVAGLGAMGSAAACRLATNGRRVLGLDRFQPPHGMGSSHGQTRIIREAYFEHPLYVPLVQRAYELWAELEIAAAEKLLLQTGGLMIGPRHGPIFSGAERSAREHGLEHRVFSAAEVRERYPALCPEDGMMAVWERRAGILFPERVIQTHLDLARRNGADLKFNETVLRWEAEGEGVCVKTEKGTYRADRLLLAAGAWIGSLCPGVKLPLRIERQVLFWFSSTAGDNRFKPGKCPIHLWEYAPRSYFYGLPDLGDGIKVALHHQGAETTAEAVNREVSEAEVEKIRGLIKRFMPRANGPLRTATVCLYTNTPDEHFILDHHPEHRQVILASPCSGHGFKFSPVIGEIAATMIEGGRTAFDLDLFRLQRFWKGGS